MKIKIYSALLLAVCSLPVMADDFEETNEPLRPFGKLGYKVEMQASVSDGQTPLWLNANKYGLSSLQKSNGYLRAAVERSLAKDSVRHWGLGYALDVVVPWHYTSKVVMQQAYVELRWWHGVLTVGSKQLPPALKSYDLSSGAQTLGINARPVPQVRLALPDYWVLPFGNGWLRLKGHVAYGRMTDDGWQHSFTGRKHRYADDVLYHSKAGYLMIGNPDRFLPLSLELGLEMASTFGGTAYLLQTDGSMKTVKGGTGVKDYIKAFVPGGSDVVEEGTVYQNAAGNQLGSWLMRLNYDAGAWCFSIYADKYFEDHSSMLMLDYDGYGTGENWNVKERRHYLLYDMKDIMLGVELQLRRGWWLQRLVAEYINTRYQSGPVYHDHTQSIADHIGGQDNYYNHYIYTGWQHWGQVMGNPLFRSPLYNTNGTIEVQDNRFKAFHLGAAGSLTDRLDYRLLATYQKGWGTYAIPYTRKHHEVGVMAEVTARLGAGWLLRGAYGMDAGVILGHSQGVQITVSKSGWLNR